MLTYLVSNYMHSMRQWDSSPQQVGTEKINVSSVINQQMINRILKLVLGMGFNSPRSH